MTKAEFDFIAESIKREIQKYEKGCFVSRRFAEAALNLYKEADQIHAVAQHVAIPAEWDEFEDAIVEMMAEIKIKIK